MTGVLLREGTQIHKRENAMWLVMEAEIGVMQLSAKGTARIDHQKPERQGRIRPNLSPLISDF